MVLRIIAKCAIFCLRLSDAHAARLISSPALWWGAYRHPGIIGGVLVWGAAPLGYIATVCGPRCCGDGSPAVVRPLLVGLFLRLDGFGRYLGVCVGLT